MHCPAIMLLTSEGPRQKREAHGIVRVRDREPLPLPKEPARRRHKRFAEDHGRDGELAEQRFV